MHPTPWRGEPHPDDAAQFVIVDADGNVVAWITPVNAAAVERIILAVNAERKP